MKPPRASSARSNNCANSKQAQLDSAALTRERRAWYLYDWANSGFQVTAVALFLGPYVTALAKSGADANGYIHPLGLNIDARSYWSYLVSLSVILQVLVLPLLGAIVDSGKSKKRYLAITAYIGAAASAAMYVLQGAMYEWAGILFLIANVAFGASVVIYNSFLPDIAAPDERDKVSSRGWGAGYLGGGILLALNLALFSNAKTLGISEGFAVRASLCSAGIWWALFTIPVVLRLRNRSTRKTTGFPLGAALRQLRHSFSEIRRLPETATFLVAYLLYKDAIEAVLALASQFGSDELKMPLGQLTLAILMVQFVAFFGAIAFQWVAAVTGAKRAVLISLGLWTATILYMYAWVNNARGFFIAAAMVAIVMGGSQALSRSLFAQLIPKGQETEYFGIYEICDKGSSWLCPLIFGLTLQFTHNYRLAILSFLIFFIAGFAVLTRVNVPKGSALARGAAA